MNSDVRGERLQVMLSPEELSALDDFRFRHRMPTRAAAVRELLKIGLTIAVDDAAAGRKSANYGGCRRGEKTGELRLCRPRSGQPPRKRRGRAASRLAPPVVDK